MVYHGITLPGNHSIGYGDPSRVYKSSDYQRIKELGLNSVVYHFAWTQYLHPDEMRPNYYNEAWLALLDQQVALAEAEDLKVFISSLNAVRHDLAYGWADRWEGPDYVNLNLKDASGTRGRERYCAWLRMLAERYPTCGIDPNGFPYHGAFYNADHLEWCLYGHPEKEVTFYEVTQPAMLEAIRSVNNQPIILHPLQQGVYHPGTLEQYEKLQTGQFLNPNFRTHDDYRNIIYGTNSHDASSRAGEPTYNVIVYGARWNYDYDWMRYQTKPAMDFARTHHVGCNELCNLYIHGGPIDSYTPNERPINQSRLDWVRATLELYKEANMSWWWYRYVSPPSGSCPWEADFSRNALTDLIAEYAPTPGVSPVKAALSALGLLIYGGITYAARRRR